MTVQIHELGLSDTNWTRNLTDTILEKDDGLFAADNNIIYFFDANDISCIDPTLEMKSDYIKNKRSMFGPKGDMHWNKEGNFQYFAHSKKWLVNTLKREIELSTVTAE